jgi:alpha-beta hydrolase superfamily lysophospholipase
VLYALHWIIVAIYIVLPAAVLAAAVHRQRRHGHKGVISTQIVTFVAATAVGLGLNLVYAAGTHGRPTVAQVLLASYFAAGMLFIVRGYDAALQIGLRRLMRLRQPGEVGLSRGLRVLAFATLRAILLFAVGLPFVIACLATYRPKVMPGEDPRQLLSFQFDRVEFRASDGTRLVGWWIPAQAAATRAERNSSTWGTQTVLVCHGLAASKSNELVLARRLVPAGFNVLLFDFRAHGESAGQLATYGALEKSDVLGAVRWIRQNHAAQAEKIFGVGASMGGAALLSAAADPSDEGRAIAAVAAYACYDDLRLLAADTAAHYFAWPLDKLLLNLSLPLASLHSGADLIHYVPAADAHDLWPRPFLLIQSENDEIIDYQRGVHLLDAASPPKYRVFYPEATHAELLNNDAAARLVVEFFRTARTQPVI